MWGRANQFLKHAWPSGHRALKDRLSAWRLSRDVLIPVPKRVRGDFFWVHPRLLTTDTTDHEPHVCQWVLDHLPRSGTLFDVGAHYGWISLKAARHVGPDGKVLAFEASPVLIDLLNYHRRRNRLSHMTVVGVAVSDADTRTDFHLLNGGLSSRNSLTIGRGGLPFLDGVEQTAVPTRTLKLDTFCKETGLIPDVLKIDVEGAEGMVLRGAEELLSRHHPVLIVAIHPFWLPPHDSTASILAFAARYGYRIKDRRVIRCEGYDVGDYLLSM